MAYIWRALGLALLFTVLMAAGHRPALAQVLDCEHGAVGSIWADPQSIALGQSSTLHWMLDGPNECPMWINGTSVAKISGTMPVSPQTMTTYVLTTVKLDGSPRELASTTVTVTPDCIGNLSGFLAALPHTVHLGNASTLSWFASGTQNCDLKLSINGKPVANAGSMQVKPTVTTAYTLASSITVTPISLATTTVTVNPSTVYIRGNTTYWKDLLVQSVGVDGTLVILTPNVNMDLTGYGPIYIRESVILTSDDGTPPHPVRNGRNLGPRLFATDKPKPLLLVRCTSDNLITGDSVKISGFRLQGPHNNPMDGDSNLERGIQVESCLSVEISNMEVAGWSGQGIYISEDSSNARMLNPDAVYIHDNYLHNNQHIGGNGYGVETSAGAYARIEHNVFDLNRHAIASSGKAGTGYRAVGNLILKGGGIHGTFFNGYTHLLDVHGDQNCPPIFHHIWNCGHAGDQYWFIDNTVQYLKDNALKLRGMPRVAAYINGNVFAHSSLGDAIELFTNTHVHLGTGSQRNVAGYDTYGRYGVCDLDGDHKDDLFLATGKTWWYRSAARMHWVFLKAATERLENVGLGDFNGDGRCDVLAANGNRWEISSGGSGQWATLPGIYAVPFNQLRFADFNGDGRTDIFRRAPDGQWSVVSPGVHGWRNLASSSFPLSDLRFGDFTGDGKADVLAIAGGHWSISRSGTGSWTKINNLSTKLSSVLIADVDGNRTDDIVRFKVDTFTTGRWQVSWGGRTDWKTVRTVTVPSPPPPPTQPLVYPRIFVGQFDGSPGDDLLHIDYYRTGRLFDYPRRTLTVHNLFPY